MTQPLLLTVGMPVYNGAATLEAAIRSVLDQTLRDLEVVISDNGSTDATPEICRRLAGEDPRIRYIRQERALSPTDNFRFVLNEAKAPFFMWAAHDDLRDADIGEKLVAALQANPAAVLAFGDLVQVIDGRETPWPLDFETAGLTRSRRLRQGAMRQLHHLYGIWRTPALRRIDWRHVDWWHDTPLMMAAAMLGDFIHVPGPRFIYLYNPRPFFGWRKAGQPKRLSTDLREFAVRAGELGRLVWLSGRTVGKVAGPLRGAEAAAYAGWKVTFQIFDYLRRGGRNPGHAPPRGRDAK
jgi:glycosyltransferase involved in cell wall biosynthesis